MNERFFVFLLVGVVFASGCVGESPASTQSDLCAGVSCPDRCEGNTRFFNGTCVKGQCGYLTETCLNGCADGVCIFSAPSNQTNQTASNATQAPQGDSPPAASLTVDFQSGKAPLTVTFYALCTDEEGNATCTLEYGDGIKQTLTQGINVTKHLYNVTNSTTFTTILTAKDQGGQESVFLLPIYVSP